MSDAQGYYSHPGCFFEAETIMKRRKVPILRTATCNFQCKFARATCQVLVYLNTGTDCASILQNSAKQNIRLVSVALTRTKPGYPRLGVEIFPSWLIYIFITRNTMVWYICSHYITYLYLVDAKKPYRILTGWVRPLIASIFALDH